LNDVSLLRPFVEAMLERIRGMEQSWFWKVRNAFFGLKKRCGFSRQGAWPSFEVPTNVRRMLDQSDAYAQWTAANAVRPADIDRLRAASRRLSRRPTFSVVVGCSQDAAGLGALLVSIVAQAYERWEIRIVAAPRAAANARAQVADLVCDDALRARITVAMLEGNEADLVAEAFSETAGEYVIFAGQHDALAADALYEYAAALNDGTPTIDVVYADEDVRDPSGTYVPFFKPGFAVDSLRSRNYVARAAAYRRAAVLGVGGIHTEFGSAFDYDLILRLLDSGAIVVHVARVLYHRGRVVDTGRDGVRALEASLERTAEPGRIEQLDCTVPVYCVRYRLHAAARVSIIVPTRDHADDLDRCLTSLFERSTYDDFEVLLIDNGSREPEALALIERWAKHESRVRVFPSAIPFNYSKLNNLGFGHSRGRYIVLLNNDTEILTADWLEAMMEQAQRPSIGAVGAALEFPDGTLQHGGVVLGIGGVAGHSHRFAAAGDAGYFCVLRSVTNYAAVTGACLMVRRELYEAVGGLDETLTVAFNDVDFCLKLLARGVRNVWLPHVRLVHGESKSRGSDIGPAKQFRHLREQDVMLERWSALIADDPYYSPHLTRRSEDYRIRLLDDHAMA